MKKTFGIMTVINNQKEWETDLVSLLVGKFTGNRKVRIAKTAIGTYLINVSSPAENGEVIEHNIHLTVESFAALIYTLIFFMKKEGMSMGDLVNLYIDDDTVFEHFCDKEEEE